MDTLISLTNLTAPDLLLISFAALVAAIISGLGGFGGGFIVVIILTPIIGAKAVIPLLSVYALCSNISRVYIYRHDIRWSLVFQITLASLPGVYLGSEFLARVSEVLLLAFLGVILLSIIPLRNYLKKAEFEPGTRSMLALGLVFGLVSGAAAGSGMFVIAGLNAAGLHGMALLGTDAAIGVVNAATRVLAFWRVGLMSTDLVCAGILMGIITLPGTWIASLIVKKLGTRIHNRMIEILIVVGGIWFIVQAVMKM